MGDAKTQLNFQILREIAECASGMRTHDLYFRVPSLTGPQAFDVISDPPEPPGELPGYTLIHVEPVPDPGRKVSVALIGDGPHVVNLMDLKVKANAVHQGGTYEADAVFWSVSAVEKFLVPYYASVYGDQAASYVSSVLGILLPGAGNQSDPTDDPAFAIAHLPSSEYTGLMMPDQAGREFVPHAAALVAGEARLVPVHRDHHLEDALSSLTNGSRSRYAAIAGR